MLLIVWNNLGCLNTAIFAIYRYSLADEEKCESPFSCYTPPRKQSV